MPIKGMAVLIVASCIPVRVAQLFVPHHQLAARSKSANVKRVGFKYGLMVSLIIRPSVHKCLALFARFQIGVELACLGYQFMIKW